ncbi:MAG: DNA ligase D [Alphaproteobacteria bacterium]|nr:DNA ligase D [Alphaproteobacteria bacterium]
MRADTKKKLSRYQAKRDFSKTAEPSGDANIAPSKRSRFVIQKHAATRLHYDFRLELDGVFKSWAVTRGPSLDPADKRLAVEVEDHPLDYGDFEGTIPKGQYGGGTVMLWDRGHWEVEGDLTPQQAIAKGDFKFRLDGKKLHGSWVLVRLKRRDNDKHDNWLLIKHRDDHAVTANGEAILDQDKSVASSRTLDQIAAGKGRAPKPFMLTTDTAADAVWNSDRANREHSAEKAPPPQPKHATPAHGKAIARLPDFIPPQLCKAVDAPPRNGNWGHEIKLDGYRLQLRVEDGKARLRTRKGLDWTEKFKATARAAGKLPDCIIDGEVCALDPESHPSFPRLQAAIADGKTDTLVYFAFDLLAEGMEDLRDLSLAARKERLKALVAKAAPRIRYVDHIQDDGKAVLEAARKMKLEGIVSKRLDAPYRSARSDTWLKAKLRGGQEVVLGGWAQEGSRFRSLLVGAYKAGRLIYLGRVGTGFDGKTARDLHDRLTKIASNTNPFAASDVLKKANEIHWAEPKLVAEIEFAGWSGDGMVLQGSYKGLREDKPANEVVVEHVRPTAEAKPLPAVIVSSAEGKAPRVLGVPISNADKVLWPEPGITKLDLARYYEEIGPWMLEHIKGRPCSIIRAPDGIGGQQFFQRHEMAGMSKAISLVKVRGDRKPYTQFDSLEAIIAAAQIAAIEFHPTNCQPGDPETPGRLVFDLDPAPDVPFARVIEAAVELNQRLEHVGLIGFCKTTGGKGLHVVTPFAPSKAAVFWDEAKSFAHEVCREMTADAPAKYLTTMAKKDRGGRIFLDYLRNDHISTAVAVLSPRARPHAPVSMPLSWSQVKTGLDPARFTLETAPALLKKSKPWVDYVGAGRPFATAAKRLRS